MKTKIILVLLTSITLSACLGKQTSRDMTISPVSSDFEEICLDGVLYHYALTSYSPGYHGFGFMAAKYDKKSGEVVRCEG